MQHSELTHQLMLTVLMPQKHTHTHKTDVKEKLKLILKQQNYVSFELKRSRTALAKFAEFHIFTDIRAQKVAHPTTGQLTLKRLL